MYFIGIDVGKKGAMCIIRNGKIHHLIDFSLKDYHIILRSLDEYMFAVVEKVHAMPKQGVSSMFTFGVRYGEILGLLECLNIDYVEMSPQNWRKMLKIKDKTGKDGVYRFIKQVYKNIDSKITGKRGGYKDGRADAIALAITAQLKYKELCNAKTI